MLCGVVMHLRRTPFTQTLLPAALLALLISPRGALAAPAPDVRAERTSGRRVSLFADSAARPRAGGMLVAGIRERWDTADSADWPVLRDRYAALGVSAGVNADYLQGSAFVDWAPLSVLALRTQYDVYDFHAKGRPGTAHRLLFSPALRLDLGPVAFGNRTEVAHYRMTGAEGSFSEWEQDLEVAGGNWVVMNRSLLLLAAWRGGGSGALHIGPGYELSHHRSSRALGPETRQRAMAALQFSPGARWGAFSRPRFELSGGVGISSGQRGDPFATASLGADLDL
jgi:hypothetical protein